MTFVDNLTSLLYGEKFVVVSCEATISTGVVARERISCSLGRCVKVVAAGDLEIDSHAQSKCPSCTIDSPTPKPTRISRI